MYTLKTPKKIVSKMIIYTSIYKFLLGFGKKYHIMLFLVLFWWNFSLYGVVKKNRLCWKTQLWPQFYLIDNLSWQKFVCIFLNLYQLEFSIQLVFLGHNWSRYSLTFSLGVYFGLQLQIDVSIEFGIKFCVIKWCNTLFYLKLFKG